MKSVSLVVERSHDERSKFNQRATILSSSYGLYNSEELLVVHLSEVSIRTILSRKGFFVERFEV